jgi:uncharacterized protein (TIGR03067 family)
MQALLVLSLVLAADATKDAANIEGTWIVVSASKDGKADDEIKGEKITFKDGKVTVSTKKKDEPGTYKIDPSQNPKTIDVTTEGKDRTHRGIYKLDGDKLTLCITVEGEGRPKDFTAKEDDGKMVIELKREKK